MKSQVCYGVHLQDLAKVVDMPSPCAGSGEESTGLLRANLHVPHLHAVLCHVCAEGKYSDCIMIAHPAQRGSDLLVTIRNAAKDKLLSEG